VSTLAVLGIVLVAVAGVLYLTLDQVEQYDKPATARRFAPRGTAVAGPLPGEVPTEVPAPALVTAGAGALVADDVMVLPARPVPAGPPTRVRSAVTLMMLVAALGVGVALLVAAVVVGAAAVVTGGVAA
jgi:hypothetical protein